MTRWFQIWPASTSEPTERQKLLLSYAAETRRFEIERFWQRTLFFWTVLGAAFVGYAALAGKDAAAQATIACFGLVASVAWTLQNRGAKYWQEAWEQKTRRHQIDALGEDLFARYEPRLKKGWFGGWEFSVSRIAIMLSDYTVLVWLALVARMLAGSIINGLRYVAPCAVEPLAWLFSKSIWLAVVFSIGWCFAMLYFGRSSPAGGERSDERNEQT